MLKGDCIHPDIIQVLSLCGHGDRILIADGNYPLASKTDGAKLVWLGLSPGHPLVTEVLDAVLSAVPVEAAAVMSPAGGEPEIFPEFRRRLPGIPLEALDRFDFYRAACEDCVRLAISTGDTRVFSNILITIGTVQA